MSQYHQQTLSQKQIQKFSPQQIQMLNLLQLTAINLEQRIKDELEENPALEEGNDQSNEEVEEFNNEENANDDDSVIKQEQTDKDFDFDTYADDDYVADYKTIVNNSSPDEEVYVAPVLQMVSFQQMLKDQMPNFNLTEKEKHIVEYIIDSLDDDGYLRDDVVQLTNDFSFAESIFVDETDMIKAIKVVQQMEPAGICAASLKECLLLQLNRMTLENEEEKNALYIIENHFNDLSNKNFEKIVRSGKVNNQELKDALKLITGLNPKPVAGTNATDSNAPVITPEFIVNNIDGELEIQIVGLKMPQLTISKKFSEMIQHFKGESLMKNKAEERDALSFVKQKINSAKWFIDAIRQRENTLTKTIHAIVEFQKDFFLTGDFKMLKPMILNDIAQKVKMDISTISRTTSTRYVQTPFGTFLLKNLFTTGIATTNGEEVSNREVQQIIEELLVQENKKDPITDLEISEKLKARGYAVARRTVAKYRDHLNIPIARLRKALQ